MGSFVGVCSVASEGNVHNLRRASESERKLGSAEANRGEKCGFTDAVKSSWIFSSTNGEVWRWKAWHPNLSAVAVSGQLKGDFVGGGRDVSDVRFMSKEDGKSILWNCL